MFLEEFTAFQYVVSNVFLAIKKNFASCRKSVDLNDYMKD
jgi:hypothetical protein